MFTAIIENIFMIVFGIWIIVRVAAVIRHDEEERKDLEENYIRVSDCEYVYVGKH